MLEFVVKFDESNNCRGKIALKYCAFSQIGFLLTGNNVHYKRVDNLDFSKNEFREYFLYTIMLINQIKKSGIDPKPKLLEYLANKTGDYFGMIEVFK